MMVYSRQTQSPDFGMRYTRQEQKGFGQNYSRQSQEADGASYIEQLPKGAQNLLNAALADENEFEAFQELLQNTDATKDFVAEVLEIACSEKDSAGRISAIGVEIHYALEKQEALKNGSDMSDPVHESSFFLRCATPKARALINDVLEDEKSEETFVNLLQSPEHIAKLIENAERMANSGFTKIQKKSTMRRMIQKHHDDIEKENSMIFYLEMLQDQFSDDELNAVNEDSLSNLYDLVQSAADSIDEKLQNLAYESEEAFSRFVKQAYDLANNNAIPKFLKSAKLNADLDNALDEVLASQMQETAPKADTSLLVLDASMLVNEGQKPEPTLQSGNENSAKSDSFLQRLGNTLKGAFARTAKVATAAIGVVGLGLATHFNEMVDIAGHTPEPASFYSINLDF